jgi:predicted RNA-binding Zn-ribbon protein involved in translation (DUF1610 family)
MTDVQPLNRTLDQELLALMRGASLECPTCGEFLLHRGEDVECPECGFGLRTPAAQEAPFRLRSHAG